MYFWFFYLSVTVIYYDKFIIQYISCCTSFYVRDVTKGKKIITEKTVSDLKKIVANIALPALLFLSFMQINIKKELVVIIFIMFLFPTLMLFIGNFFNRILKINNKYFRFLMSGYETGMLGYAIFLVFFGQENLPAVALVDLGQGLFVFFILLPFLNSMETGETSVKSVFKTVITSPVIIAIVSGLIIGAVGFNLKAYSITTSLLEFINIVGGLTTPLIMISLGYEIQFSKNGFFNALKTVIIRKIIMILAATIINEFVINKLLHLPKIYSYAVYTVLLMPPPICYIYFYEPGR